MPNPLPTDLQQFVEAHLASGRYTAEDEVLQDALRVLAEEEDDLVAVREAIDEWRAGDEGIPLAEAFDQVRYGQDAERTK